MNRRTLLRCYPRHWRERYGDEFLALLEQQRLTPAVVLDVLLGALDAHLQAHVFPIGETLGARATQRLRALRATALTVFCAYITFVVAGLAFFGMVDDTPFIPMMRAHAPLFVSWLVIEAGAAVALAAVVAGGLPIGLATLSFALAHKRRDILKLLAVPLLVLGAEACMVALLSAIFVGWLPTPFPVGNVSAGESLQIGNVIVTAANAVLFVIGAITSTIAVATAVTRSTVGPQRFRALGMRIVIQPYRFALLPATIAALAMTITVSSIVAWGVITHQIAPHLFTLPILLAWLTIVAAMSLATLIATAAVVHGHSINTGKTFTNSHVFHRD